ncbi:glutamine transport ATP-binding protein GlnQ [Andreesenia angusta]|uniref:Glutamine transport ATP-binding protein GlnQ n=1 Tax=Andreesenia angusta TaxID=39480 RepID=A0A1S1V8F0_9FIRM|nr:phosphonate ABC transporter ATP-binding protein [Andreesenia angusta]OHW62866.1 glutamine transport ATP-binding protein GlnQ [Andreesenia angusta]
MSREVLRIENISKNYGKIETLSSLSLVVERGEMVALIGPSGSGKSTLLNLIGHLIAADSGNIYVEGKSIDEFNNRALAKKIGMVRQNLDLVPQLSVINNVLAGKLSDWSFIKSLVSLVFPMEKELALSALRKVGIEDKYTQQTSKLSGGEQQRVALARLLVQNPDIVLADEPVSSLDPARAEDVLSLMSSIAREENKTLVASIHSVEYARKFFTRVVGLRNGRIEFDMPTEKLTERELQILYSLEVG